MQWIPVITSSLALLTALVRWRREVEVRQVCRMKRELRRLELIVDQLETDREVSARERETLQAENKRLRKLCDDQAQEISRLHQADEQKEQKLHDLGAEVKELKRQIKVLLERKAD